LPIDHKGDALQPRVRALRHRCSPLQQKFHTFLIYPPQRVEAAGGRYEGVDIRASTLRSGAWAATMEGATWF
jgi:hypothetical protein